MKNRGEVSGLDLAVLAAIPQINSGNDRNIIVPGNDLPVDNTAPPPDVEKAKEVTHVLEPVHILAFKDTTDFGGSRITNLDPASIVSDKYLQWMESLEKQHYDKLPYSGFVGYEIYHKSVFPDKINKDVTLSDNGDVFPTGTNLKQSRLRDLKPNTAQHGQEENIKIHDKRIKTCAKLALMMYRDITTLDSEYSEVSSKTYQNFLSKRYKLIKDGASQEDIQNHHKSVNYLHIGLSIETIQKILAVNYSDDIPFEDSKYLQKADYGLWGKWYDDRNGFHRGIDICYGAGHNVYSICEGEVVDRTYMMLTVKVEAPSKYIGKFVTYMHCDFINFNKGDKLHIGTKIGTEGTNGGVPAHTHMELNTLMIKKDTNGNITQYVENGFLQLLTMGESIFALEPYDFIEECYKLFYNELKKYNN